MDWQYFDYMAQVKLKFDIELKSKSPSLEKSSRNL